MYDTHKPDLAVEVMQDCSKTQIKKKHLLIWLLLLLWLIGLYLIYMARTAPMGLHSPGFHQQRIYQAVNTILNADTLPKMGLTAWNDLEVVSRAEFSQGQDKPTLYLLNIVQYMHYSMAKIAFPAVSVARIARFFDLITLIITSILLWMVSNYLFISERYNLLLSACVSLVFASSVWTYRAFLAPAKEFYMLPILLFCILCFINKHLVCGSLLLALSSAIDYHWSIFIFITYSPAFVSAFLPAVSFPSYLIPPSVTHLKKLSKLLISGTLLFGFAFAIAQKLFLKIAIPSLIQSNSNLLYRIGIDSADNIHYGGILGPFQFLLGQRVTVCLIPSPLLQGVNAKISMFNCSIILLSSLILSLISITGIYLIYKNIIHSRWILWPLSIAIFCFSLAFPQSWSAHLSGYSYMFAPLFSIGLIYFTHWALEELFDAEAQAATALIYLFVTFAVIINSIRLSFLTGINA